MDLSQSDWKYVDERAGAFVGREWVFARVRSFLSGAPGTFLLRGDPGTGKTAVAARLARASCGRLDAADSPPSVGGGVISAGVFCRAGKATVAELVQRLSDQLSASVDGFADALRAMAEAEHGITIGDVHVDVRGDVHAGGIVSGVVLPRQDGKLAFSAGVAVPLLQLRERGAAEPIVLLVDAVDEAADVGEVNVFSRLLANLDEVHLLVTCRPDPSVLSDFRAAAHKLDLIADAPADDDDVCRYIRNRLRGQGPEEAVDVLAGRVSGEADGNFLYAFYVTGTLIGSGSLAGLDERTARGLPLPTGGLSGVYEDFLDRQVAGDETRWAGELRPVLAPLCVALGDGFTTAQLAAVASRLTGQDFSVTKAGDVTRAAGQFLDGPRPSGPFQVYHQSFSRFLTDPGQNPNWLIDLTETNTAVARGLIGTVPEGQPGVRDWAAASGYVRRHLAAHAAAAGILDDLLLDSGFLVAADPAGLLPVLNLATSPQARQVAWFYRIAADGLRTGDLAERAAHLQLAAGKTGYRQMARALGPAAASWHWATRVLAWRPPGRYTNLGRTDPAHCSALKVTAHGDVLVVTGAEDDGMVALWRAGENGLVRVGPPQPAHYGASGVQAVAVGQVGGEVVAVTTGDDGMVALWRAGEDGLVLAGDRQPGHGGRYGMQAVAVGQAAGQLVAVTGGDDGTVALWRAAEDGLVLVGDPQRAHSHAVAVAVAQLGDQLVAVTGGDQQHVPLFPIDGGDGVVALWRASEDGLVLAGDPQPAHSRHAGGVRAVAVGQLGGQLVAVTGGGDGTVALWQASDGRLVHAPAIRIPVGSPLVSIALLSPTAVLAWCEDGVLTAAIRIPQV